MAGRSPKGNTAQGNTLGVSSLTNWRAVSATGASEVLVRSFLLLFQSASLLEHLYPGRCPGLYSYWAFSPSLLSVSTVVRCHDYTPVELSARLCSQHQLMCDAMIVRLVGFQPVFALSINYCTVFWAMCCCAFVGVKKCLAKFVSFVERGRSLKFQEKNSFLLFYSL